MSAEANTELVVGRPASAGRMLRLARPGWQTGAKLAVSAGLLLWLFGKVQADELSLVVAGDWLTIVGVWLLLCALPFVQAVRWRLIAASLDAPIPFSAAVKNIYIGHFFNQVLPSAIGGDAVRIWKLTRLMPVHTAVSSIALDRVVALVAVLIILAVGSGLLLHIVPAGPARWSLFAIVMACGFGLLLLLSADRIPLPVAIRRFRVTDVLYAVPPAARRLCGDPGRLVPALAISIVIHFGVGTSLWMLARSCNAEAPITAFLLLAPLVTLVTTIPISVGGWGVREGAMVTALGLVGVSPAIALSVSIQFGLIMLIVGLPGGVLTYFDPLGTRPTASQQAPG
jgi:uncharacterized membrane protein YbhN (UPF0104 family)